MPLYNPSALTSSFVIKQPRILLHGDSLSTNCSSSVLVPTAGSAVGKTCTLTVPSTAGMANIPGSVTSVINVNGCTPAAYNGLYTVTSLTGTTITYTSGSAPGGNMTGFGAVAINGTDFTAGVATRSSRSWIDWIIALSGGRFSFTNALNKGWSGNTSTQELARYKLDVANNYSQFDILWLQGPTNDVTNGISTETSIANMTSMATQAANANKLVIVNTILPRGAPNALNATQQIQTAALNQAIRALPLTIPNLIVFDPWRDLADPTTGAPIAGTTLDGLHISMSTANIFASRFAQQFMALFSYVPQATQAQWDTYDVTNNVHGNLIQTPLMTGTNGSIPGANWGPNSVTSGSAVTTTCTLVLPYTFGLVVGSVVTVAGCTPAAYNGTYVLTGVTSTTITYTSGSAPGGVTTVQGTVSAAFGTAVPVVSGTATGAACTLTLAANACAGLSVGNIITVAGCTPAAYNGSYAITALTANTVSYTAGSSPGGVTTVQGTVDQFGITGSLMSNWTLFKAGGAYQNTAITGSKIAATAGYGSVGSEKQRLVFNIPSGLSNNELIGLKTNTAAYTSPGASGAYSAYAQVELDLTGVQNIFSLEVQVTNWDGSAQEYAVVNANDGSGAAQKLVDGHYVFKTPNLSVTFATVPILGIQINIGFNCTAGAGVGTIDISNCSIKYA